jgi:hypothetical protein
MIVGNVSRESAPNTEVAVRQQPVHSPRAFSTPKRRTGAGGLSTVSGQLLRAPIGKCPAKTKRIDIGLAILSTMPLPRGGRSCAEIAAYCGCSREAIRQIKERALRRLRVRCIFLKDERLREAGEEILGRSVPR